MLCDSLCLHLALLLLDLVIVGGVGEEGGEVDLDPSFLYLRQCRQGAGRGNSEL